MLTKNEILKDKKLLQDRACASLVGHAIGDSFGDIARSPDYHLQYGITMDFSENANEKFSLENFLSSFIPLVSIILILSICSNSNAQTSTVSRQPFRYEVYLQKDTFLVGELVDIGVNIINTSKSFQKSGYVNIKMFNICFHGCSQDCRQIELSCS